MKARCLPASLVRLAAILPALALCLGAATSARAQQGPVDGVCVIDIKWILDHHTKFQADMANLKKDFEDASQRLQQERDAIVKLENRLKEFVPGSPEYRQLDETVSQRKASWALLADKQRKEIRTRESDILAQVYSDIQARVTSYCEKNRIGLVIQFSGEPIDPRKDGAVFRAISRSIVYNAPNRNITFTILEDINRNVPAVPGSGGPGPDPRAAVAPQGVPLRQN